MCSVDIFLGLLAVLFPPLPVWVKRGICSADSVINILLFILGYVPGLLHSWYIIAKYPEPPFDYTYQALPHDPERGRIYVCVHGSGPCHSAPYQGHPQPQYHAHTQPHTNLNYGTTSAPPSNPHCSCASTPKPQPPQPQLQPHYHPPQEQGTIAGPSDPPPSYAQVVAGDYKIQTQD